MTKNKSVNVYPPIAAIVMGKDIWNSIMTVEKSSLSKLNPIAGHMVFQILAFVWSGVFSIMLGSYIAFGISAVFHIALIAGIYITVYTFEHARKNPNSLNTYGYNGRASNGEHI